MPSSVNQTFWGIRSSKFRHVYGKPAKKESCYENVLITQKSHDIAACCVNPKFLAVAVEVAGGGAFIVLPLDKTGRIDVNTPKVSGHSGPIYDIKWSPFNDNLIGSASDDCTVKLWHIPDGGLKAHLTEPLVDLQAHQRRVAQIEWHPTAENILFSVGCDYMILIWDVGMEAILQSIDCHADTIYSISLSRDGSRLATTCRDKKLRIIEPRSGRVLQETVCHEGSRACKAVYVGDTGKIFTVGFSRFSDRQYAVWDENDLSAPLRNDTIDSSSGILTAYYDHDTRIVFVAGKGDGNIRYYEIADSPPYCHFLNQYISGGPQSDQFQPDIYPDTASPTPALSADEWFSGMNKGPVLMSMKTGVTVKTHRPFPVRAVEGVTSDKNADKKYAFLNKETRADYRPLEVRGNPDKDLKTSANLDTKFQQLQKIWGCNIKSVPDNRSRVSSGNGSYVSAFRSSNKTNESHTTVTNLPYSNSPKKISYSKHHEKEFDILEKPSPKTEAELRRAYTAQCEELKLLRRQLVAKDRRIRELEDLMHQMLKMKK